MAVHLRKHNIPRTSQFEWYYGNSRENKFKPSPKFLTKYGLMMQHFTHYNHIYMCNKIFHHFYLFEGGFRDHFWWAWHTSLWQSQKRRGEVPWKWSPASMHVLVSPDQRSTCTLATTEPLWNPVGVWSSLAYIGQVNWTGHSMCCTALVRLSKGETAVCSLLLF